MSDVAYGRRGVMLLTAGQLLCCLRPVSNYVACGRSAIMLLAVDIVPESKRVMLPAMDIVPESKRVLLLAAGDE